MLLLFVFRVLFYRLWTTFVEHEVFDDLFGLFDVL